MRLCGKLIFLLLIVSFTDVIAHQVRIRVDEFATEESFDIFRLFVDDNLWLECSGAFASADPEILQAVCDSPYLFLDNSSSIDGWSNWFNADKLSWTLITDDSQTEEGFFISVEANEDGILSTYTITDGDRNDLNVREPYDNDLYIGETIYMDPDYLLLSPIVWADRAYQLGQLVPVQTTDAQRQDHYDRVLNAPDAHEEFFSIVEELEIPDTGYNPPGEGDFEEAIVWADRAYQLNDNRTELVNITNAQRQDHYDWVLNASDPHEEFLSIAQELGYELIGGPLWDEDPDFIHPVRSMLDYATGDGQEVGIVFTDANLEAAVRSQLGVFDEPLYAEDVAEVEVLELRERDIRALVGLEVFTGLRYLDLIGNEINDVSLLSSLPQLEELFLNGNNISDISSLFSLTRLRLLDLGGNNISDISSLSLLTQLEELFLYNNDISDISSLSSLTHLHLLDLSGNHFSNVSRLSSLQQLEELFLAENVISDVSPLSALTQLEELFLNGNNISDISSLSSLTRLRLLDLGRNDISDISSLSLLTQLEELFLYNNDISVIPSLSALTRLVNIDLSGNRRSEEELLSGSILPSEPSPQAGYQARILVEEFATERRYDIFRLFADGELLLECSGQVNTFEPSALASKCTAADLFLDDLSIGEWTNWFVADELSWTFTSDESNHDTGFNIIVEATPIGQDSIPNNYTITDGPGNYTDGLDINGSIILGTGAVIDPSGNDVSMGSQAPYIWSGSASVLRAGDYIQVRFDEAGAPPEGIEIHLITGLGAPPILTQVASGTTDEFEFILQEDLGSVTVYAYAFDPIHGEHLTGIGALAPPPSITVLQADNNKTLDPYDQIELFYSEPPSEVSVGLLFYENPEVVAGNYLGSHRADQAQEGVQQRFIFTLTYEDLVDLEGQEIHLETGGFRVALGYQVEGELVLGNWQSGYGVGDLGPYYVGDLSAVVDETGNQTPFARGQTISIVENEAQTIQLVGSDADGDDLIYALVREPLHGSASLIGSVVTYVPIPGYDGSDSFTYTVSDGTALSPSATVAITINGVNEPPLADDKVVTVLEDETQTIVLSGADADGDVLTYALITEPTHGTVILIDSVVTYVPAPEYHGVDEFTFSVSDGIVATTATVSISIVAVNDKPNVEDVVISGLEDEVIILTLAATDIDSESLTYLIDVNQTAGQAILKDSVVVFTPALDFVGRDSFSYRALDGQVISASAKVFIDLEPVEDAPRVEALFSVGNVDETQIVVLVGEDPDADEISFILTGQPAHGDITLNGSILAYVPDVGFIGTDTISYLANDGKLVSTVADITFAVGVEVDTSDVITVIDSTAELLSISPNVIDFGQVRLGRNKEASVLIVNNTASRIRLLNLATSNSTIQIDKVIIYDDEGKIVSESTDVSDIISLNAQQEVAINVIFRPTVTGVLDELFIFSTTATDFETVEIPLRGVAASTNEQAVISSPLNSLDFGEVVLGEVHLLNLPIHNDGNVVLNVFNAISDNLQVRIAPKNFTVQPGQSKVLEIQLIPLPRKPLAGELTFNSDDATTSRFVVPWLASLEQAAFLGIAQSLPVSGEILVDTETQLQLVFDEPLFQRGRYVGLDIALFPRPLSGELLDKYELRGDGRTVVFPVELAEATDYRLVIFSASSAQGAELFEPIEYAFTTGNSFQPKGQLAGSIATDSVDKDALIGGFVSVFDTDKQLVAQEPLAADGSFVVEDLPVGDYQLVTKVDFSDGTTVEIAYDGDANGTTDIITIDATNLDITEPVIVDFIEKEITAPTNALRNSIFNLDLDHTKDNQALESISITSGDEFQVSVYGNSLTGLTGYVLAVDYDPTQVQLIRVDGERSSEGRNVLKTGTGLPVFIAATLDTASNDIGPAGNVSTSAVARFGGALLAPNETEALDGSGLLAVYRFQALEDFTGATSIVLSEVIQRSFAAENTLSLAVEAIIKVEDQSPQAGGEEGEANTLPAGPISLDGNSSENDQEQRIISGAASGAVYELQLNIVAAPEISGWSATIEFDPEQVQIVNGSFAASGFIPGLLALTSSAENTFELGGTVLGTNASNSGDATLGSFSVELLEGFSEETTVRIVEVQLRLAAGGSETLDVYSELVINVDVEPSLLGDFDGDGFVDYEDFFIFANFFGGTDPVADFDGDGFVSYPDLFIFADQFGKEERAKLIALAVEYLGLPQVARLGHNYPNPFNAGTTIPYMVGIDGPVTIQLYDIAGQLVRTLVDQDQAKGYYQATWDGTDEQGMTVSTGIYLVQLQSHYHNAIRKITLIK